MRTTSPTEVGPHVHSALVPVSGALSKCNPQAKLRPEYREVSNIKGGGDFEPAMKVGSVMRSKEVGTI